MAAAIVYHGPEAALSITLLFHKPLLTPPTCHNHLHCPPQPFQPWTEPLPCPISPECAVPNAQAAPKAELSKEPAASFGDVLHHTALQKTHKYTDNQYGQDGQYTPVPTRSAGQHIGLLHTVLDNLVNAHQYCLNKATGK